MEKLASVSQRYKVSLSQDMLEPGGLEIVVCVSYATYRSHARFIYIV